MRLAWSAAVPPPMVHVVPHVAPSGSCRGIAYASYGIRSCARFVAAQPKDVASLSHGL
jgi:hypothetical protein